MGRIYKSFMVETPRGKAKSEAKIDSGADITLVRRDVGKKIGVDVDNGGEPIVIGGLGGRVLGFEVPAKVTIGQASAQLKVVVPFGRYDAETDKIVPVSQKENLIGHDFLQATRAKIDFSRHHDDAFVDGETRVDDVVRLKITRAEAKAFREWVKRQSSPTVRRSTKKTITRHHVTKRSPAQLEREIAEALNKKVRQ